MKTFFLRELAFLVAPVMLISKPGNLITLLKGVGCGVLLALVMRPTLLAFVLQPAGWVWMGVLVGVGAIVVLAMLTVMYGSGL